MRTNGHCSKAGGDQISVETVTAAFKRVDPDVSLWQEEEPRCQAKSSMLKRTQPAGNDPACLSATDTHARDQRQNHLGQIWHRFADLMQAFVLFWSAGSPALSVRFGEFSNKPMIKGQGDQSQWIVFGIWFTPFIILGVVILVMMQSNAARRELINAESLWEQGRKNEAGALYQSIILKWGMFIPREDEGVVYGRAIDYLAQNNRREDARQIVQKFNLNRNSVPLQIESQSAQRLIVEVRMNWVPAKRNVNALIELPEFPLADVERSQFYNASGFYHIYHSTAVQTDLMFTGTVTFLIGVVGSIEVSPQYGTIVHLATNQNGEKGVQCILRAEVAKSDLVEVIKPGDYVKIRGRCEGKSRAGFIVMTECDALIANEE